MTYSPAGRTNANGQEIKTNTGEMDAIPPIWLPTFDPLCLVISCRAFRDEVSPHKTTEALRQGFGELDDDQCASFSIG